MPLLAALAMPSTAEAGEVYVTGSGTAGNAISPFAIGSNGSLTPISCPGASCVTGGAPIGVAMTPDGQHLYASSFGSSKVSAFSVAADGSLTPVPCPGTSCNTGAGPYGIAVTPDGQHLYAVNNTASKVSAFSIGSDGSLTPVSCPGSNCNTGSTPVGVAVSPNGQFLYAANRSSNSVSAFSIGADGSLTPISCSGCTTGAQPSGIAVTPSGQYLYTANRTGGSISAFSIGANGGLTAVSCGPGCGTGTNGAFSLAITPDGGFLYATMRNAGGRIVIFSIAANGVLTPVSCPGSNCVTGANPGGVMASPDSKLLFASVFNTDLALPFTIGSGGSLTPISCASPNCNTADGPDFQSVVVSPDQAPVAAFTSSAAQPGQPSNFDASGSTASPGQTVARYDWDFGDGQSAMNADPTPSHTYASEGDYTVTLTVTDDAGCSTTRTYTGQTVSCNGSSVAQASETVSVQLPDPPEPPNPEPSGARCPTVPLSVAEYTPGPTGTAATAAGLLGHTVPGVRAKITIDEPSLLQISATLRWSDGGRSQRADLGASALGNAGMRNLRLALPSSLIDDLPRDTRVTMRLRIRAFPDSAAGCVDPSSQRISLRTKVVKVLASASRLMIRPRSWRSPGFVPPLVLNRVT